VGRDSVEPLNERLVRTLAPPLGIGRSLTTFPAFAAP